MAVQKNKDGTYMISGPDDRILVSTYGRARRLDIIAGSHPKKSDKWAEWGSDNLLPNQLTEIVWDNHNKPELIQTQADFLCGQGPITYIEELEGDQIKKRIIRDPQVEEFFEEVEIKEYFMRQAWNFALLGNVFTEFIFNRGRRVHSIKAFDGHECRAGRRKKKDNHIPAYYISSNWKKPKLGKDVNTVIIPNFNKKTPRAFSKCMFHARIGIPGNRYYDPPGWYGTRNWTRVANKLPVYHENGMDNGYSIKYHIEIPKSYFVENFTPDEMKQAEADLMSSMDKFLAGADNAQKAFVSRYGTTYDGKPTDGWRITPIKNEKVDQAYKDQFAQSNTANLSGHGIAPSLAGLETQGKLSSGSEKRNDYNIYIALKTGTPRDVLLKPIRAIQKINGWNPDIKFGFRDVVLTSLDNDRTGVSQNIN